jgi:hypothetical protein
LLVCSICRQGAMLNSSFPISGNVCNAGECDWIPSWFEDFMIKVKYSARLGQKKRYLEVFKIVAALKLN